MNKEEKQVCKQSDAVLPKACSKDPLESATSSQRIRGYISVIATLKFTYFLITKKWFVKNNSGTSLIGCMSISYDR